MESKDNIEMEVIKFISKNLSVPLDKVRAEDSLFHDYGVDGDDAVEFLQMFSSFFGVEVDDFVVSKYFGPETTSIIEIFSSLITRSYRNNVQRLTVNDLIDGVRSGRLSP